MKGGKVAASLPLTIANLMTDENPDKVIETMKKMKEVTEITNKKIDPFMNLSFISLTVIGDIRLLPGGVFSIKKWKFI